MTISSGRKEVIPKAFGKITNEEMLVWKIEYIHNNPVRCGYVDEPICWRYSSARNYEGLEGLLDVKTDWYDND